MLFLVVGPSGAGKDTLIDAAREALADDSRYRFAQRVVTRPPGIGENHRPMDLNAFAACLAEGGFLLHWEAHGLRYGVPADIVADLHAGRHVVANVSRGVIAAAAARFEVTVIEVTAPAEVLARRLAGRGRETAAEIADRLARAMAVPPDAPVVRVVNDSTPEAGAARMLAALQAVA